MMKIEEAVEIMEAASTTIGSLRNEETQYDEISILFDRPSEMVRFVELARRMGFNNFHSVKSDSMVPEYDAYETFGVSFEFLKFGSLPWRIECMTFSGDSSIHRAALNRAKGNGKSWCLFHVSLKVSPEVFKATKESVFCIPYSNSYGYFAYIPMLNPDLSRGLYVKPRVSFADADAMENQDES